MQGSKEIEVFWCAWEQTQWECKAWICYERPCWTENDDKN